MSLTQNLYVSELDVFNKTKNLCKEIGNFFGEYREDKNGITIDTGEKIYKYFSYSDMLQDWVDTLIESQENGGGNWEEEIMFIYFEVFKKPPIGVRCVKNRNCVSWKASVDICNPAYPHGRNVHLGTYDTISAAIFSRKNFLNIELKHINTKTKEGLNLAIEKAKARQETAKKLRKKK